jgi:Holliday junction resolvase RusA-like endonuclease
MKNTRAYQFIVEGTPVPKARPRVVNIKGRSVAFMPKPYMKYRQRVADVARLTIPEPMECVMLSVIAYLSLNKSDGKISRRKPDLEGIFGSIADALEGIAYEKDWSVFTIGECNYRFIPAGEPESVLVYIEERDINDYILNIGEINDR